MSRPSVPPRIEGQIGSVSSGDIRTFLDIVQTRLSKTHPRPDPIYKVTVVDHKHINVGYYIEGGESCDRSERVQGQWIIPEVERKIVTGINIPTG